MTSDEVNKTYLNRAAAMFARVSGKPCVNVDARTGKVHYCDRIYDLNILDDALEGTCDWQESDDDRPDELTEGLGIGSDLLDVGEDWWFDMYFDWYLVFSTRFVSRSACGDHSWVPDFLAQVVPNRTIPRPPPTENATHTLPEHEALQYFG